MKSRVSEVHLMRCSARGKFAVGKGGKKIGVKPRKDGRLPHGDRSRSNSGW